MNINIFCLLEDRKLFFLFRDSMNSGSQPPKGIFCNKICKNYALWFFLTSIISDFKMENHFDLIKFYFLYVQWSNTNFPVCFNYLNNFEVLCKWYFKEHLKNPLQYLFSALLLSLISKYSTSKLKCFCIKLILYCVQFKERKMDHEKS